jgi:hypothetical protein
MYSNYFSGQNVAYFVVARDGGTAIESRVMPPRMTRALAQQLVAAGPQMAYSIAMNDKLRLPAFTVRVFRGPPRGELG